jgi:hypothetical protein
VGSRGIRYLLVSRSAFGANDFYDNPDAWGIQHVKDSADARLYRLKANHDETRPTNTAKAAPDTAPPGDYDDFDARIRLRAAWTRDRQFPDADRHTLTYSNVPGAMASLRFSGDAITYVYTRAYNRGIAEVLVDGLVHDRLDLYSANTVWKSRARYDRLGPGTHVFQIYVTGQRNSRASDCFVDVDALVVE